MKTQLICFEGLSPFLFGTPTYIKRGLLDDLEARVWSPYSVWRGSFMSSGPGAIQITDCKTIVLGHSMGAPTALWWCRENADWLDEIDLLVTLDPRPLHRPYVKPANVKRAVNFYQTGFMRGYEVEGSENVRVYCKHTEIPGLAAVRNVIKRAMR